MSPTNRIVVDYGGERKLVLLAKIHTHTSVEYPLKQLNSYTEHGFEVARSYDGILDITHLRELEETNKEGFVIRFASGLRLKLKFAEYTRLHVLLTEVNARVIWDLLRNNQSLTALLEKVPDEFYAWVKVTRENLEQQFRAIEMQARAAMLQAQELPTRKEQAAYIKQVQYPGVVFAMLDGKPYYEIIWKMVRPAAERPFREESES